MLIIAANTVCEALFSLQGPEASGDGSNIEALIVLEIDRHSDQKDLASLENLLQDVLHEVRVVPEVHLLQQFVLFCSPLRALERSAQLAPISLPCELSNDNQCRDRM